MKNLRCRSLTRWGVLPLLLLGCSLFTSPLIGQTGQTWVEVMINGPWVYLPDNSAPAGHPRIVLIAPESQGHNKPVVFSGPNAAAPPQNSPQLWPAAYALLIDNVIEQPKCGSHPPSDLSLYYPVSLTVAKIQAALDGTAIDGATQKPIPRFAITLPKPCYATSMYESRSKMDGFQIAKQAEKSYATWTALHYLVASGTPSATLNGVSISFAPDSSYPSPSLSIVMASDDMSNDNQCDHVSLISVEMSAKLLGLDGQLYAQFPIMLGTGGPTYQTHAYSDDKKCRLPIMAGTLWVASAGSGDCHLAQININKALQ